MGGMKLHVELFYDGDVRQWGYRVPALSILGTGCNTRDDAERFAMEAVEDAIESGAEDISAGAEVMMLDVRIAKAG
jgi:hypothetical protein